MKNKKTAILIGMFATVYIMFNACKKDPPVVTKTIIEHDTVQHAWQAEPMFNGYDQYITTAYATGNGKVFFYGEQEAWYVYDSAQNQLGIGTIGIGPNAFDRPAVNKTFFAKPYYSTFLIESPYNSAFLPTYSDSIKHLDPFFSSVPFYANLPLSNIVDISDSNRFIFPAQTINNPKQNGYYLMDAKINIPPGNITVNNFHRLFLGCNNNLELTTINHFGNRFFVGANDTTYLIREDFSTKMVVPNDMFYSIFKWNNNYYATAGFSSVGNIYETTNNGETWTLQYTFNPRGTVILNFDNNLIAIYQCQLWQVTLGASSISFKEIVNDGLTGKTITGLVKCNNKVWISTNGGVFYRPYNQFYQYK